MEKKELDEVVERARVALANGNWDESKHPRGEGGRFGKSGKSVSEFVSKSETKKVPVEVKKGSTMDEHYAAHYSKATDAEVRSAAETYGKYDDEDSVSRMKAIKDEIERRFGIGNTAVNTEGKKPESSEGVKPKVVQARDNLIAKLNLTPNKEKFLKSSYIRENIRDLAEHFGTHKDAMLEAIQKATQEAPDDFFDGEGMLKFWKNSDFTELVSKKIGGAKK